MSDYAFEGPKWSDSTITWSFAAAGGDFTGTIAGDYQSIVRAALAAWSAVAAVTFRQVDDGTSTDVRIGWGQFSGSQVGETDYRYSGSTFLAGTEVLLEDPSARAVGSSKTSTYAGTSTTLYQVALHEIGHSLGLAHSTDASAVMYPVLGPSDPSLNSSDIAGITSLYGAAAVAAASPPTVAPQATTTAILPPTVQLSSNLTAVYRFFDETHGTQFLTGNAAERDALIATRPDLSYEGLGLVGITPGTDPTATPVYRFFDTVNGTHFYTSDIREERALLATRADLVLEQSTFYAHTTQQSGDVPVYRFFDSTNGTHFYTDNQAERASIAATRADLVAEGIAFYTPNHALT